MRDGGEEKHAVGQTECMYFLPAILPILPLSHTSLHMPNKEVLQLCMDSKPVLQLVSL